MADDDDETPETALWRQTVERLLANGSSPVEALDGANLIMQAYRRQLAVRETPIPGEQSPSRTSAVPTPAVPTPETASTQRVSGVRRRITSRKFAAKK